MVRPKFLQPRTKSVILVRAASSGNPSRPGLSDCTIYVSELPAQDESGTYSEDDHKPSFDGRSNFDSRFWLPFSIANWYSLSLLGASAWTDREHKGGKFGCRLTYSANSKPGGSRTRALTIIGACATSKPHDTSVLLAPPSFRYCNPSLSELSLSFGLWVVTVGRCHRAQYSMYVIQTRAEQVTFEHRLNLVRV